MGKRVSWLKGVVPPVVTPFGPGEELDEDALRNLVDVLIEAGVHCLFPSATSGEFYRLSLQERKSVFDIVVDQANGRRPVVAGCHTTATRHTIELANYAKDAGADAIAVLQPIYFSVLEGYLYRYYKEINDSVDIPLMLYSETGVINEPSVDLLTRLADLTNTVGIKFSTANMERFRTGIGAFGDKINVLVGWEDMLVPGMTLGAVGGVLACANFAPDYWVKVYDLASRGRFREAGRMETKFLNLLFPITNRFGWVEVMKAAANARGIRVGKLRGPGGTLPPKGELEVARFLKKLKLARIR